MTPQIRRIGPALLAALAIGAVAAPAAVAETEKFHTELAGEGNTSITGEKAENQVFTGDFGTITCTKALPETYDLKEGSPTLEDLSLKVHYTNCTTAGGMQVISGMRGCRFTMTKPTNVVHTAGPPAVIHSKSAVHITCPPEEVIEFEIVATGCVITIPAQTPTTASTFDLTSQGAPKDILLTPTMEGIHYTMDGFFCGGGGGTTTNGVYKGALTLKGYDTITGTQVGIWAT